MKLDGNHFPRLVAELRERTELDYKRDIQIAARAFERCTQSAWFPAAQPICNGDDAAALPTDDGYVLFAAEGIRGDFVAVDPWFAGFSSVMVNVNDIAAMGGRPWAIVDVLFKGDGRNESVLEGMAAASAAFGVPVVGGHTSRVSGPTGLAVAVLGRAKRVISSAEGRPGQVLLAAIDLKGTFRGSFANFNAATTASSQKLRAQLAVLPELAEASLVAAGKDISMAGICGTLLMLLEASDCGAVLDVGRIPAPGGVDALRWLCTFPSFGFVLAAEPAAVSAVCARFDGVGVACVPVGELTTGHALELFYEGQRELHSDLEGRALTGFGPRGAEM